MKMTNEACLRICSSKLSELPQKPLSSQELAMAAGKKVHCALLGTLAHKSPYDQSICF